jgi:hypothetical protein
MWKCIIFVAAAGWLLLACFSAQAQTSATQLALEPEPAVLGMTLFPGPRVWVSPIVLPIKLLRKPSPPHLLLWDAADQPYPSLENLLAIESFQTPMFSESSFPVAHLWRGLRLVLFQSTIHPRGPELGWPDSGMDSYYVRPFRNDQAGVASSIGFTGISLRYTFGRDEERAKSVSLWRCVSWVIGDGRGCRR